MLDDLLASFLGMDALDERFIAHRHRSSRLALGVCVTLIAVWFTYELWVSHRIHWDLLVILAATALTKVTSMLWLARTACPMRIRLIGHSTVLFEMEGVRLLTDPFFGSWGNPAYARVTPPALAREEVGPVDAVLLSHNHWDHTDRVYFRSLSASVPVIAPRRARWVTRLKGARTVVGVRPWEALSVGGVRVTAVPALHMATTVGFVLEAPGGVAYFAGDTYHRPFMRDVGARFRLDVALMPITTYRIPMTMGERGAVQAVRDLRVPRVIPIHLALQPRSPLLRTRQSPQGFAGRLAREGVRAQVEVLEPGGWWQGNRRPAPELPAQA
ncbi:MAG: MBL fold metallo-hydrolase [Gemmatimonadetes bacterium]|nr:MBL fold metallo-hydrolase [Gemmatimonadota bacterium]